MMVVVIMNAFNLTFTNKYPRLRKSNHHYVDQHQFYASNKGYSDTGGESDNKEEESQQDDHYPYRSIDINNEQYFRLYIRHLLQSSESDSTSHPPSHTANESAKKPDPKFPPDLFTEEQRRQGAVACHIAGKLSLCL